MDPLSIAASVAGIIAAAASIAKAISPYASSLKTLPPIALRVRSEIVNTQFLLGALQNLTHNLETSLPSRTGLIDIEHLEWVFTDGVLIFSELESTITSIEPPGERLGSVSRMTWVRSETTLKGLLERLGLFKESVLLLLNILQCNSDSQASLNQQALHRKVDTLRTGDEQLARRMMNIEDAFDSLSLLEKQSTAVSAKGSLAPEGAKSADAAESSPRPEVQHETDTLGDEDRVALDSTPNEQAIFGPPLISMAQQEEIPVFTFDPVLQDSRAYQRSRVDRSFLPSHTSEAQTNSWSIFSGITLSDVSAIAAIALPVYPKDISNPQHYDFTRPDDAPKLQVRSTNLPSPKRSRYSPSVDVNELWEANSEYVIGDWAQTRVRVFKLRELRYDFSCKIPVIFVAEPSYRGVGPVSGSPITFLTGDDDSRQQSFTTIPMDLPQTDISRPVTERKATSLRHPEKASWLVLLEAVQNMESRSLDFMGFNRRATPADKHSLDNARAIAVAIQTKTISWKLMPQGVSTAYGTTTWSYLVTILAMLSVYWVALDIPLKTHHAEGNGFLVTSHVVAGLGISIRFQRIKRSVFQARRVIPTQHIKELAFGRVETTIIGTWERGSLHDEMWNVWREPTNFIFDFGSHENTVASLTRLGCNSRAAHCFSRGNPRRSRLFHLFPVLFEVVGMLGLIHHIRETPFRFLPNPTMFHWDQSAKSMKRLMESFRKHSGDQIGRQEVPSRYMHEAHSLASTLLLLDWEQRVPVEALHDALDSCDRLIFPYNPQSSKPEYRDPWLKKESKRLQRHQELIFNIISRHLQEILLLLSNETISGEGRSDPRQDDTASAALAEMDEATPEDAPSKLMDIYFNLIRPKVTKGLLEPMEGIVADLDTVSDCSGPSPDEIWCMLVFRMICWLSLHDFDEADVQRSQASLHGSRLKVYIS